LPFAVVQAAPTLEIEEIALATEARSTLVRSRVRGLSGLQCAATLLALTVLAVLVDGYHPYSEDAGIYVASIKQLARPGMYPASGTFLAPYVRLSLFSHFGAWLIRALHLPFESLLFAIHVATIWLLLYGCYALAKRCFQTQEGRWGAVLLVALCLSVPVAGTSLSLMDPYLTGRSFSTPFTLLAASAVLDRRLLRACLYLGLTALFHPLMGAYAVGFALVIWAVRRRSRFALAAVALASLVASFAIQLFQSSVVENPAYRAAVATREYFFLSEWQWYEVFGLIAPISLLALFSIWRRYRDHPEAQTVALASVAMGSISLTISLIYCHVGAHSYRIAALQPLRPFLFVYYVLFLLLGALADRPGAGSLAMGGLRAHSRLQSRPGAALPLCGL